MNKNWIQESKIIADELKSEGFSEEFQRIIDAIESGSTGGEILMALRWNLKKIEKENPSIKSELKHQIKEIIKGITNALEG